MDSERDLQIAARLGTVMCALVAAYFLLTAGYALSDMESYASNLSLVLRYVVGPLVICALLLAAARWLRPNAKLTFGVTAVSVMIGLFLLESYLTIRSFSGLQGLNGFLEASAESDQFTAAIPPTYTLKGLNNALEVDAPSDALLGGIPNADVLLCSLDAQPVSYTADAYGFRNPEAVHSAPVDVLVLGDSFTEGICLPGETDLVGHLREIIPGTLNTGTRGAGPLFELAILRRWGPEVRPAETVMFFFEGNDIQNLANESRLSYLRPVLDGNPDMGALRPDAEVLAKADAIIADWWTEHGGARLDGDRRWLRNFFALQNTVSVLGLHYPRGFDAHTEYDRVLQVARETVEAWNGGLTVVYIPAADRFFGLLPNAVGFDALRTHVTEATAAADVSFIDLTTHFNNAPDPRNLYAGDAHFSVSGAALTAKVVADHLRDNGRGAAQLR